MRPRNNGGVPMQACANCGGSGALRFQKPRGGPYETMSCPECSGTGEVPRSKWSSCPLAQTSTPTTKTPTERRARQPDPFGAEDDFLITHRWNDDAMQFTTTTKKKKKTTTKKKPAARILTLADLEAGLGDRP